MQYTMPLIWQTVDSMLKYMNEGKDKLQLEEVRNHATELKKLINQLSEGILSPLSSAENEWKQDELLVNMRQLLEQQEKRKEQLKTARKPTRCV